jgi:hypothetical protein
VGIKLTVNDFIEKFYNGSLGKKTTEGKWRVLPVDSQVDYYLTGLHTGATKLIFESSVTEYDGKTGTYKPIVDTVAYRFPDGLVIYNANVLRGAVRKAWGSAQHNAMRSECQIQLDSLGAKPIPFSLFTEMGLRIDEALVGFKWHVVPVAETLKRKEERRDYVPSKKDENGVIIEHARYETVPVYIPEHFAGRALFQIDDAYYLFDVDRKEQEVNGIFNPFVVQLPAPASSIEEAYEMLKPQRVKDAIRDGIPVDRQGEFFFIKIGDVKPEPVTLTEEETRILRYPPSYSGFFLEKSTDYYSCSSDRQPFSSPVTRDEIEYSEAVKKFLEIRGRVDDLIPGEMTIGGMTRHTAKNGFRDRVKNETYVTGIIQHNNREHGDLNLEGWWLVVPNTGVKSVTIEGRID